MTPPNETRRALRQFVLAALLLLSLFHFVRTAHASRASGFVDFPIFLQQAVTFLETGELYVDPSDPEAYAPSAPVYKFPPLFAATILLLAIDGAQNADLLLHWWIQLGLYAVACAWLIRTVGRRAGPSFTVIAVVLALNFEPFFETLWRLQVETPLLLLVVLATWSLMRGAGEGAGAAIGIGFSLKLYPGFLALYLLFTRRVRALLWFAVAVVLATVATWIVIGPAEHRTFLGEILPRMLGEQATVSSENVSPARYLQLVGLGAGTAKRVGQAIVLVLIGVTALAVWRTPRREGDALVVATGFSAFVPLMLLAMPNSWVNYQLLLLVPLVVLARRSLASDDRAGQWLLVAAYLPLLFYAPCAAPTVDWPCAQTPWFLGLGPLPRPLHDAGVGLRGLSPLLLWAGLLRSWHRA